jgi:methionyl-tRNA formyltransferase
MSSVEYIYSQGNRLEDRNTYFYTRFLGEGFINAWREAREHAAGDLLGNQDEAVETSSRQLSENSGTDTRTLLHRLMSEISSGEFSAETRLWTDILRKRFEVSKRVYCSYASEYPHKPIPGSNWLNLELYTGFSGLMDAAYALTGDIVYLNVLLKCNDTLVSVRHLLSPAGKEQLADLLRREEHHIERLLDTLEIKL